jgi:hypothetical protein
MPCMAYVPYNNTMVDTRGISLHVFTTSLIMCYDNQSRMAMNILKASRIDLA